MTEPTSAEVAEAARGRLDDVAVVLTELSSVLLGEEEVDQTLYRVADLARRTIPGCDAAGVTLTVAGRPRTAAYTDERTLHVDQDQYEAGEGPCLDAIEHRRVNRVDVAEAGDRWPAFLAAAKAAGIRSFLAAPLLVGGDAVGALNLYSRSADGFDALDETFIALFTGQAAAALANSLRYADLRRLAGQLEEALASRAVIEQAKGILMARHRVDATAAFDLLRSASQQRNVKLRVLAQDLVDTVHVVG